MVDNSREMIVLGFMFRKKGWDFGGSEGENYDFSFDICE